MMIYIVVKLMVAAEHTMMMAVMVVNVWWGDWTLLHTYALLAFVCCVSVGIMRP